MYKIRWLIPIMADKRIDSWEFETTKSNLAKNINCIIKPIELHITHTYNIATLRFTFPKTKRNSDKLSDYQMRKNNGGNEF